MWPSFVAGYETLSMRWYHISSKCQLWCEFFCVCVIYADAHANYITEKLVLLQTSNDNVTLETNTALINKLQCYNDLLSILVNVCNYSTYAFNIPIKSLRSLSLRKALHKIIYWEVTTLYQFKDTFQCTMRVKLPLK